MNIVTPSTLPGFMELMPQDQILFNKMMDTIRKNYERFGFLPLDTPIIEKSEVLKAKGAGETEQQIYKVVKGHTDMSMRFDLTVPLAKYVAQYYSQLSFPFRRYQIGKVYRGERNQRGRFREFYQCDIDIIGDGSIGLINDAEIPSVIYSTFKDLGFDSFKIVINNRKILNGLFNSLNIEDTVGVLRTVDKIEKIGRDAVEAELTELGCSPESIVELFKFLEIVGTNDEILAKLKTLDYKDPVFIEGRDELETVVKYIRDFGVDEANFQIDLTIARGLDYYTGTVYETMIEGYESMGSVCSGGRYDDLAEFYINRKLPGVGISIGLTRLFYQLKEANLINFDTKDYTKAIVIPMDEAHIEASIELVAKIRNAGFNALVYTENAKLGKKFKYADSINAEYAIVIGDNEIANARYSLRNMETGEQNEFSAEEIVDYFKR
ncbi:MAG: histidine--tRNA ligase [Tissierellia bacterium]|nr:histidine--tRNA ligase [Tissierellia bacterium]